MITSWARPVSMVCPAMASTCVEASQLHLAGTLGPIPAGRLRLDALPHSAYRRRHTIAMCAPAAGGNQPIPQQVARSQRQMRTIVHAGEVA
jgi:hypothetical protein